MKAEEYAKATGAQYREDGGWGHLEELGTGGILVHCGPGCFSSRPHGRFTRWVIQSPWTLEEKTPETA